MDHEVCQVTPRVTQVRQFVIPGCPTNCFVVRGRETNFVVDTGFGTETADLLKGFLDPSKRTLVVLTHSHWDHVWGNGAFADVDIVAHFRCRENLVRDWNRDLEKYRHFVQGEALPKLPTILFDSELRFPGDGVILFSTPGHTDDGANLFLEEDRILIVGDNIGDNQVEILPDLECPPEVYAKVIDRYLALEPTWVLSGHHSPADGGFLRKIRERLP